MSAGYRPVSWEELARQFGPLPPEPRLKHRRPAPPPPPEPKPQRTYPDPVWRDPAPGFDSGRGGTVYVQGVGDVASSVWATLNFSAAPHLPTLVEQLRRLGYGT